MLFQLINNAKEVFGDIFPCDGKEWEDCLTYIDETALLWFNTSDGSTHIISNSLL